MKLANMRKHSSGSYTKHIFQLAFMKSIHYFFNRNIALLNYISFIFCQTQNTIARNSV